MKKLALSSMSCSILCILAACAKTPAPQFEMRNYPGYQQPGVRLTFHIIPVGRISSQELFVREGGGLTKKNLAVYCYLIQHPTKGNILIDLGYPEITATDPGQYPGFPVNRLMKIQMNKGDHPAAKIRTLGFGPEAVSLVLFTHLHNDHMGDIREFSSSRILVHKKEWESALTKGRSHGFRPEYLSFIVPETFEFPASAPYGPFDSSFDVLGDGTIMAVPTPGHTAGHVSYFVHTGEQSFFLTGDAAWVEENYVIPARKGLVAHMLVEADRAAQKDSLARIHYLYTTQKDLLFISGHDGKVLEDTRLTRFL